MTTSGHNNTKIYHTIRGQDGHRLGVMSGPGHYCRRPAGVSYLSLTLAHCTDHVGFIALTHAHST